MGWAWTASYISRAPERLWRFTGALYNHLWEPKGNLGAFCGVCLNPRKGGYEQIGLAGEVGPLVVTNPAVRSSPRGTKGA